MNIEKEKDDYLSVLLEKGAITESQFKNLVFKAEVNAFYSEYMSAILLDNINFGWSSWQASALRAEAKLEGCVVVHKKNTEDWYLDPNESVWWEGDQIGDTLCDINIGEVTAVEHRECLITESNTLFAAIVWDVENEDTGSWTLFKTEEEAEQAAAHCKAMIEAARGGNEH